MNKRKKTTILDIANELNITASTVSRALQDHPRISQPTKDAVWEMVKKLNYQPNSIASALRKGKSNTIGVIVPTSDRPFFASVIRGIEEVVREHGYNLIICQSDDKTSKEIININALLNIQVECIIASVAKETTDVTHFQKVIDRGTPLILYDRVNDALDVNAVVSDDYLGSYKAVTHLIEQGCRRIAHFAGEQHINIYQDRLKGYKAALRENDIPIAEDLIIEADLIKDREDMLETGKELSKTLLQMNEIPDGIFSSSDYAAIGAMQSLKQHNINIPDDVAVVGYSNDFACAVTEPGLTSVEQHTKEMGNMAAKLFLEQSNTKQNEIASRKTLLNPKLVTRGSSLKKESTKLAGS